MKICRLSVVLMALLLAAMTMVPLVNAAGSERSSDSGRLVLSDDSMTRDNITLKVADSKTFSVDLSKYDKELTKEEFLKANQKNIEKLAEKFGRESAEKMADTEYNRIFIQSTAIKTVSSSVVNVWGYDIYLWPYQARNPSTSDPTTSPVNFIVLNYNAAELMAYLQSEGWSVGYGWNEYGLRGQSSNSLSWINCDLYPLWTQMELGSYFGDRYHAVISNGLSSSSLGDDWSYGNCHREYWTGTDHLVYGNGFNDGRSQFYTSLSGDFSAYWISLYNSVYGYADGMGLIFE